MIKKILAVVSILGLVLCFTFRTQILHAAAPYFQRITATATATSTPAFMTPGTATSTLIADVYQVPGYQDTGGAMDLFVASQYTGSSTATTFGRRIEYSNGSNCVNNPNNCDWYSETSDITFTGIATTTYSVSPTYNHLTVFASSTPGGRAAPSDREGLVFRVPVLMQYVRIINYLPIGSANGAVWQEVIGVQQRF